MTQALPWDEIDLLIKLALQEDIGQGDITTDSIIPDDVVIEAEWVSKEPCCVAGIPIVEHVFQKIDSQIKTFWMIGDSQVVMPGKFGLIKGPARGILKGERLALNFLQRLSGIATLTATFVKKVQRYGVKIYDTRKTTPGMRVLEKYAVRMGGGMNHRLGLDQMVLIKDNHRCVLDTLGCIDWRGVVQKIRKEHPESQIEIECNLASEVETAIGLSVDFVLLDNMSPDQVQAILNQWKGKVIFEASGGIHLGNIEEYARTGVDRISIGALTHSVKAIDISMEVLGIR